MRITIKKVIELKKPRKKRIKVPVKKVSIKSLDKSLDSYYSKYIRLRDSEDGINATCCSCGRTFHIKEMDNGHFISRAKRSTKYDERNTHAQCKRCNIFLKGNISDYAVFLEERYGFGILQELKSKSNTVFKSTVEWYKSKINHYKKQVAELDKYNLWGSQ